MSDTSELGTIITNAKARKVIYGIYVIAVVALTAIQVAYSAVPAWGGQPNWLIAAIAVAAYLGIPIGGLALANTNSVKAGIVSAAPAPSADPAPAAEQPTVIG